MDTKSLLRELVGKTGPLNVKELSEISRLHPGTLREWARKGAPAPKMLGEVRDY